MGLIPGQGIKIPYTMLHGLKKNLTLVCMHAYSVAQLYLFVTLRTVAPQAPLSMGFSKKEYWSGLPCPPPGDLPNPGVEPASPHCH